MNYKNLLKTIVFATFFACINLSAINTDTTPEVEKESTESIIKPLVKLPEDALNQIIDIISEDEETSESEIGK